MRLISRLFFSGAVAVCLAGGAAYAQGFQEAREAMEKACTADIASLCAGKTGREAGECLRDAGDKVSAPCKDALSKMGAPGGGRGPGGGGPGAGGPGGPGAGGAARPPRAPPSEGGTVGTIDSVSPGTIEITMSSGQKATVLRSSHTTYRKGTSTVLGSTITPGETIVVLGIIQDVQGEHKTAIDANQVIADAPGIAYVPASDANLQAGLHQAGAQGGPQGGARPAEQKVGQVPSNYVEGEGTIVVDTVEANKALLVALAAYPNGIINRVVKLSDGVYECHHIGVAWPHHVFVTSDFKYIGAF